MSNPRLDVFDAMDTNHDGMITREEFASSRGGSLTAPLPPPPPGAAIGVSAAPGTFFVPSGAGPRITPSPSPGYLSPPMATVAPMTGPLPVGATVVQTMSIPGSPPAGSMAVPGPFDSLPNAGGSVYVPPPVAGTMVGNSLAVSEGGSMSLPSGNIFNIQPSLPEAPSSLGSRPGSLQLPVASATYMPPPPPLASQVFLPGSRVISGTPPQTILTPAMATVVPSMPAVSYTTTALQPLPMSMPMQPPQMSMQSIAEPTREIQMDPEYYEQVVEVPKVQVEVVEKLVEVTDPIVIDRVVEVPQIQEVITEDADGYGDYDEYGDDYDGYGDGYGGGGGFGGGFGGGCGGGRGRRRRGRGRGGRGGRDADVRLVTREVPKIEVKTVETIVEVPEVHYADRLIEVPVVQEVVRRIPRVRVLEIPVERVIQVPKKVIQEIEQPIYRPVPHLVKQPVEREIPVPKTTVQQVEVVNQYSQPEEAPMPMAQASYSPPATMVQSMPMMQGVVQPVAQQTVVQPMMQQVVYATPPGTGFQAMPVAQMAQPASMVQVATPPGSMALPVAPATTGFYAQTAPSPMVFESVLSPRQSMAQLPIATPASMQLSPVQSAQWVVPPSTAMAGGQSLTSSPYIGSPAQVGVAQTMQFSPAQSPRMGGRATPPTPPVSAPHIFLNGGDAFSAFDRNRDGVLSRDELASSVASSGALAGPPLVSPYGSTMFAVRPPATSPAGTMFMSSAVPSMPSATASYVAGSPVASYVPGIATPPTAAPPAAMATYVPGNATPPMAYNIGTPRMSLNTMGQQGTVVMQSMPVMSLPGPPGSVQLGPPGSAQFAGNPFGSMPNIGYGSYAQGGVPTPPMPARSAPNMTQFVPSPTFSSGEAGDWFDAMDRNHDGRITREEFNQSALFVR